MQSITVMLTLSTGLDLGASGAAFSTAYPFTPTVGFSIFWSPLYKFCLEESRTLSVDIL